MVEEGASVEALTEACLGAILGGMSQELKVGDWVYHPGLWSAGVRVEPAGIGIVGKLTCDGTNPCPCCGLGVSVHPGDDPNRALGFSPRALLRLDRAPAAGLPTTLLRGIADQRRPGAAPS